MKKTIKALMLSAALALSAVFCTGCGAEGTQRDSSASVWDSALYTEGAWRRSAYAGSRGRCGRKIRNLYDSYRRGYFRRRAY